jgi:hypothetical protein
MLSTDIHAAAPEARFGLTEVKWSIYPFGRSTIKLIQQIGYVHAMGPAADGALDRRWGRHRFPPVQVTPHSLSGSDLPRRSRPVSSAARFVADPPLEGTGFELPVPPLLPDSKPKSLLIDGYPGDGKP